MRRAIVEFHYAADGKNAVRYRTGAGVPVKPEHVDQLVAEGKIEGPPAAANPAAPKAKRGRRK